MIHATISPLKSYSFYFKAVIFVLAFFTRTDNSSAQYRISIGANYVHAFGENSIDLIGTTYDLNATNGFEVVLKNAYRFDSKKIGAKFNLGYRQLHFSGSSSTTMYHGFLRKVFASAGVAYWTHEKFNTSAYIEAENNLEFEEFNLGMGDLFRVSLALEANYMITSKLGASVLLSRAMTPITPAYTIYNPQYQIRIGLNFKVL